MIKSFFLSLSLLLLAGPVFAAVPLNVLYLEVDDAKKLVAKDTPVFRHIYEETGDFLDQNKRINLITQQPTSEPQSFRTVMKSLEEIPAGRFDAIVLVSVKRDIKRTQRLVKNRLIARADIVDPDSLEVVDRIRIKSPMAKIRPYECGPRCRYHVGQRHVQHILPAFQKEIRHSLRTLDHHGAKTSPVGKQKARSHNYTLTLKGFEPREIRFIENRIARLDGTKDLSSLRSRADKPAYWVEREKRAVSFREDLSHVLSRLDLKARLIETEQMITLIKVKRDLAFNY